MPKPHIYVPCSTSLCMPACWSCCPLDNTLVSNKHLKLFLFILSNPPIPRFSLFHKNSPQFTPFLGHHIKVFFLSFLIFSYFHIHPIRKFVRSTSKINSQCDHVSVFHHDWLALSLHHLSLGRLLYLPNWSFCFHPWPSLVFSLCNTQNNLLTYKSKHFQWFLRIKSWFPQDLVLSYLPDCMFHHSLWLKHWLPSRSSITSTSFRP